MPTELFLDRRLLSRIYTLRGHSSELSHGSASLLARRREDGLSRSFALPKRITRGRATYNSTNRSQFVIGSAGAAQMWQCPKCQSRVDDSFEVCWSCGTTPDGIEDPDFVTADEADPIPDEEIPEGSEVDDPLADFAGTPLPNLVECYMASSTIEAKFIADQLMEQGIPAIADRIDINLVMGGFQPQMWGYGPKIRVREDDLPRALAWLKAYDHRRKAK